MQKRPVALVTGADSSTASAPAGDGNETGFDPELYRVPLGFLEEALYGAGGIDRVAETSHELARAVMARNVTNPLVRNEVLNLETRLNHLAELDGDRPAAAREWQAIRREYFKPAGWLHATPAPISQ